MTLFPDVQKKAQAEIDAVVGNDRLPKFADRTQLPYVDALAKEVLRWNAVTPIGVIQILYVKPFLIVNPSGSSSCSGRRCS